MRNRRLTAVFGSSYTFTCPHMYFHMYVYFFTSSSLFCNRFCDVCILEPSAGLVVIRPPEASVRLFFSVAGIGFSMRIIMWQPAVSLCIESAQ